MNADVAPSRDVAAVADVAAAGSWDLASMKLAPIDAAAVHSINHKAVYPN